MKRRGSEMQHLREWGVLYRDSASDKKSLSVKASAIMKIGILLLIKMGFSSLNWALFIPPAFQNKVLRKPEF
ncbi:hypothetical protein CEXT_741571 [Caerostris extrusa]|uniref:Uncharacterized protein n=1 Tax=Caerostris extrusa TaxID=172846 RepID=A0AAV4Q667_CAEEX|nr:hypothetical protein CEXT_741571 [Caerostris extrusa]